MILKKYHKWMVKLAKIKFHLAKLFVNTWCILQFKLPRLMLVVKTFSAKNNIYE